MTRLTLTEAHELAAAILRHAGFSEAFAQAIAATVTAGERDGCKSTVCGACSASCAPSRPARRWPTPSPR